MRLSEPTHINDLLQTALEEINKQFRDAADWPLIKRNQAIAARNHCFAEHAEVLGLDPTPMPFEKGRAA